MHDQGQNFVYPGYTNYYNDDKKDMYLAKKDSVDNELWNKTFDASGTDYTSSIAEAKDGGFISCGAYTGTFYNSADIFR